MTMSNRFYTIILTWLLLSLAIGLGQWSLETAQAGPPAQAPDCVPSVSAGRLQWVENCQPCHGPTGLGDGPTALSIPGPLPNFSDPQTARQRVPADAFDTIKNGRVDKLMPPWGDRLSDSQIWDAAAYAWSLSTRPQDLAAGETIYLAECSACHGENGRGNGPEAAEEMLDFTDLQVMMQRSQADLQAGFTASPEHEANALSDAALWQTLDYIRTFSFEVPQRDGILTGQVINATTNKPQGSVEVTLHVYSGEVEVETFATQADRDGNFSFENLVADHTLQYVVEGRYQDVAYLSEQPGLFVPNSNETRLNLNVFETTTDPTAITVIRLNYLLAFGPEAVQAVEVFVVENVGDRTFVGQNGQTFSFSLPQAAENVTFEYNYEGRFIAQEGSYADTAPVIPGRGGHSIIAFYDIPYDDDTLTIEIPLPVALPAVNIFLQDIGASLSSNQLQFVETREGHGDKFSIFSGSNLTQDDTLTLQLSDLDQLQFNTGAGAPNASDFNQSRVDQNVLRWSVVGLGGLLIVAVALVYPIYRPQLSRQAAADADKDVRLQKLLLMLARLDEVFEAGELDQAVYRQARSRYKAELATLMKP